LLVCFCVRCLSCAPWCTLNTKTRPCWRVFMLSALPAPPMYTEHENTWPRACFRVRRLACITPSIEPHPRWCVSVLGAFPAPSVVRYTLSIKTCPRWRVLMLGAFSAPPMHTEHENTPTRACLCVRRLPFENARWGFPPRLDFSYVILSK